MGEQTYYRLDLAKEQLDIALDLFLDQKKFSAAITLAGASEEIFGRALKLKGITPAVEKSYEAMARFHDELMGEKLDRTQYIDKENFARNALKHLQNDRGPTIEIDLEEAACWMLVRALQNGKLLEIVFERDRDFDNWFYENIIGV
ncbi:hypothetical protein [Rhodoferax sp. U11-2br]|uniref:hypothetical protein n=1 Tax=Rhodoferax sp. U11-2br TaxID=2838878 RepID=UPI001BE87A95|nr:hypothetical protein [Rhodoferax sp. U11-2br]MBT3068775.1 hypothetical protein [Rhodoferax sp. U11-2br]